MSLELKTDARGALVVSPFLLLTAVLVFGFIWMLARR